MIVFTLAVVAVAMAVAGDAPFHDECIRGIDINGKPQSECGRVIYTLYGANNKLKVNCQGDRLECTARPRLTANNASLELLHVTDCSLGLATSVACAVRASGASDAREIEIYDGKSEVSGHTLLGLDPEVLRVRFLRGVHVEKFIPSATLASLSRLTKLTFVSGSNVRLQPDMFRLGGLAPPLKVLEIGSSGVPAIPAHAFKGLSNLTTLNLWGNNIENVSVDAFKGLESLQELFLHRNPVRSLPAGALGGAGRLRIAKLSRSHLTLLGEGVFSALPHLHEIEIQNDVQLTLGSRAFSSLPSLTSVTVSYSGVTAIPSDLFFNTTTIIDINFMNNCITKIPEELFWNLTAMRTLNLSGNAIETVTKEMIANLTALTSINLDGNKIRKLPEHLFSELVSLVSVSLNNNQIHAVAESAFQNRDMLRSLNIAYLGLQNNNLSWDLSQPTNATCSSPLDTLAHLRTLDLSHNGMRTLCGAVAMARALTRLNLSFNRFTVLTAEDFNFFANVHGDNTIEVDFRHNDIREIHLPSLINNTLQVKLLIDDNPFKCDCNIYEFINYVQTQSHKFGMDRAACTEPTSLSRELLKDVSPDDLICTELDPTPVSNQSQCFYRPALDRTECEYDEYNISNFKKILNAKHHQNVSIRLRRAPKGILLLPDNVRELNLSGLQIENIPEIPNSINVLDVSKNNVKFVPDRLLRNKNLTLLLIENPLKCDCSAKDHVIALQNIKLRIRKYNEVTCELGQLLEPIDPYNLCGVFFSSIAGLILGLSLVFLCVLATIAYLYRIHIQVFLYSKRWCLYLLPKEVESDKLYDVYVVFASSDERFVCRQILPKLEGKYNMHVQDRDWEVGGMVQYQMRRSIAESQKTLVVTTPQLVAEPWAMEMLALLHTRATIEKQPHAIILLVDINKQQIDKEMRSFLSLATLIQYGRWMYWDRIFYYLPKKDLKIKKNLEQKLQNNHKDLGWKEEFTFELGENN